MKRGRTTIIAVLIVALLATGAMQMLVQQQRTKMHARGAAGQQSNSSLSRMDSYALALLLGGLRGPLVMFLWTQSESQKGDRDLQGLDTQIEWIRLLQPEFDTVHLFQIWNKAYNLSVQMAALSNKYATILDAIDYARSVDGERPNNINIISQLGSIYGDKLGGSQEKDYYRRRARQDTAYSASREKRAANSGQRRTAMPMLVDAQGNLLPDELRPTLSPPLSAVTPVAQTYNGADLEYLEAYQPFPYGVSTLALAYNYYKRAQVLQDLTGQRHIQMGDSVVDSRPALALENWGTEEWEVGRRSEIEAWGMKVPYEKLQLEAPTAAVSLTSLSPAQLTANAARLDEAAFSYARTVLILQNAEKEYRRHMANPQYADDVTRYRWHMDHIAACAQMLTGDLAFLNAVRASGKDQDTQVAAARDAYRQAARMFKLIRLRYFVQDDMRKAAYPTGINPQNMEQMTDAQVEATIREVERRVRTQGWDANADDVAEYTTYVQRCAARLSTLQ